MKFVIGTKEYMTRLFSDDGPIQPVTVFRAEPATVTYIKNLATDGYDAVQLGAGRKKAKNISKPERGHTATAVTALGEDPHKVGFRYLTEVRCTPDTTPAVGDSFDVSSFAVGDKVAVTGRSKGKGFQGGVKRHGFAGKSATHGTKHAHREVGSVGATGPQRIFKGRKMPGRMGYNRVTVKNLKVAYVDPDQNLIALRGAVPGKRGDMLEIKG